MTPNSRSRSLSFFFIFTIMLATGIQAVAGRDISTKSNEESIKQPEWFTQPDGSVVLPGIGRILVPMPGGYHVPVPGGTSPPITGSGGDSSGSHLPGGDDTFVPNPGYEIPAPAGGIPPNSNPRGHSN